MASNFSFLSFLFFNILIFSSLLPAECRHAADDSLGTTRDREALEIIIGGGGAPAPDDEPSCPPPPPPPCPPPPPPPSPKPSPVKPSPTPPPPPPPPKPSPVKPSPTPPPPKPHPSPRPRPPMPSGFENARLERAYRVIQMFKKKITKGNLKVRDSWKGYDVCQYKGFRCDKLPIEKERSVSGVSFNGLKFDGPNLVLNGFIDKLEDIAFFHANSNFFRGRIPQKAANQRFVYEIDLSNNKLSAEGFPVNVLTLTNLTFLDLRFNDYVGSIPEELFNLDIITAIFINNNRFNSCLPPNLGKTPARYITFANNKFTGQIPRSIGEASKTLKEIVFLNNSFTGCLPYEIGFLNKAVLFDVGNNQLTGPIPLSFACLAKMELLYLADNQFYGPVPELVCRLPKLGNLTLRNNFFTEVGPECRKLIKKKVLDISKNCVPDLPNQKSYKECAEFFSKPKYCGDDKSFQFIHCKSNWYLYPHVSNPNSTHKGDVTPKKTDRALSPHHAHPMPIP